jgi:hypothetical protein
MQTFISNFGNQMVELNQSITGNVTTNNSFKPGIGPYGEDQIVDMVMERLQVLYPDFHVRPNMKTRAKLGLENYFGVNGGKATPDLILQRNKIIEFKIARPIKDNGDREDTWFKKCFEPAYASYSSFVDVDKLCKFNDEVDKEQSFEKWIIVIGFERSNEQEYKLDQVFPSLFKYISHEIKGKFIKDFVTETFDMGNRHPFHQVLKLYAFKY